MHFHIAVVGGRFLRFGEPCVGSGSFVVFGVLVVGFLVVGFFGVLGVLVVLDVAGVGCFVFFLDFLLLFLYGLDPGGVGVVAE